MAGLYIQAICNKHIYYVAKLVVRFVRKTTCADGLSNGPIAERSLTVLDRSNKIRSDRVLT